jgi:hypothetical protein
MEPQGFMISMASYETFKEDRVVGPAPSPTPGPFQSCFTTSTCVLDWHWLPCVQPLDRNTKTSPGFKPNKAQLVHFNVMR